MLLTENMSFLTHPSRRCWRQLLRRSVKRETGETGVVVVNFGASCDGSDGEGEQMPNTEEEVRETASQAGKEFLSRMPYEPFLPVPVAQTIFFACTCQNFSCSCYSSQSGKTLFHFPPPAPSHKVEGDESGNEVSHQAEEQRKMRLALKFSLSFPYFSFQFHSVIILILISLDLHLTLFFSSFS